MNKLKKIVAKAMNKRASEWKLGKLIAEDIEQEKKLHGAVPITNYAVYWNIQVFNDMKELDVPQLSKKAQDAIFDDIEVALQGGFSKGEIQLQKEDLEEEDIKILNEDLLLEFFLNFEEEDLDLDDVEIDLGNTYDGLPESYVKFRQLANKKKQVSKMASIISKEILKSAKVSKKAEDSEYESIDEIFKEEKLALQKLLGTKEPIYKSDLIFDLIPVFTIGDSNDMYAVSANEQDIKRAVEDSLENLFDGMRVDEFVEKVVPYIGSRDVNDYMEDYEENDPYVWGYKYTGSVDFEKMAEDVINEYGAGHELAPYDGRTDEIEINGKTYYIFRQQ